ncbi:MAG: hypothetical protein AAGA48_27715 [Myxococcota bacterium]
MALRFDGETYDQALQERVERLITALSPSDLSDLLMETVTSPGRGEQRQEPDGSIISVAEERAEQLGARLAVDIENLLPRMPDLLRGEQRQGYVFGMSVGSAVGDPVQLLRSVVDMLTQVPVDVRNPVVGVGIARASHEREPADTRAYVLGLLEREETRAFAVPFLLGIGLTDDAVLMVASHLGSDSLPSTSVRALSFGGVLRPLEPVTVAALIRACADADDGGPAVALDLLAMRQHNSTLEPELLDCARDLVLRPGVLELAECGDALHELHIPRLAEACLDASDGNELIHGLAERVMAALGNSSGYRSRALVKLTLMLFARSTDVTWKALRRSYEKADGLTAFHLELALDDLNLVSLVGSQRLLDWCGSFELARFHVSRMIDPLQDRDDGARYPSWTPFALSLLERFGDDADLRNGLAASIHSGGWTGSRVPRLTMHRDAYAELSHHPNPAVSGWAREHMDALDQSIEHERKRDEEEDFGIYR